MKFFVGWDVGGWHCDRNRESRDAIAVLATGDDGQPQLIGRAWRGSLRQILVKHRGIETVREILRLCDITIGQADEVLFAIDAPLGWPKAMLSLATGGPSAEVSGRDYENPYTRRETELDLIRQGFLPLSNVRDMIGSQSTKAIHFLRVAELVPRPGAVWSNGNVSAIETYPAVALKEARCAISHGSLLNSLISKQAIAQTALPDIRDALACAVVAYMAGEHPNEVVEPPADYPDLEGWIIVPKLDGKR